MIEVEMAKRIHPAFKQFILSKGVKEWDRILTKYEGHGIAETCFQTSNAFCNILTDDFGIDCKIVLAESLIGNQEAMRHMREAWQKGDTGFLYKAAEEAQKTKGKDNLTSKDPVLVGMGYGDDKSQFHFIINLPQQKEVIDLTLAHIQRPKWGISCKNYWAKYEPELGKKGFFISDNIQQLSGCVLFTSMKETSASIGINPHQYVNAERELREVLKNEVKKRNIPVFMR